MLNHFNITNVSKNITKKYTAYKIILDNFNIYNEPESKRKSDSVFEK